MSVRIVMIFTEILGAAVRCDSLIRGNQISDRECKISQYTDDTTLILDCTRSLIDRSFVLRTEHFLQIIWPTNHLLED